MCGGVKDMAKILVVEDEHHIVRLVQVNLERAGHEIIEAIEDFLLDACFCIGSRSA